MAKSTNIITRVDPIIKQQAESVLNELGLSMASAMEIYLRQIALQKKIPFEISLPSKSPTIYETLSQEQFNALMETALKSYNNGECIELSEFEKSMDRK